MFYIVLVVTSQHPGCWVDPTNFSYDVDPRFSSPSTSASGSVVVPPLTKNLTRSSAFVGSKGELSIERLFWGVAKGP